MKDNTTIAAMLLLACIAQFGHVFAEDEAAANNSINASLLNETLGNATLINGTSENSTLENATLINGTLENETSNQEISDPFANAKNRQPKRK